MSCDWHGLGWSEAAKVTLKDDPCVQCAALFSF